MSAKEATGSSAARDDVRPIHRLALPDGHGDERQLVGMLHERKAADPGGVELLGEQHGRDLLVGPALDQAHGPSEAAGEIRLQGGQELDVGIEEDRREAEIDRRLRAQRPRCGGGDKAGGTRYGLPAGEARSGCKCPRQEQAPSPTALRLHRSPPRRPRCAAAAWDDALGILSPKSRSGARGAQPGDRVCGYSSENALGPAGRLAGMRARKERR